MADTPTAISGISDPREIRVKLLASNKEVHAPLSSLDQFYDLATVTHAATAKTTLVDADEFSIWNSVTGLIAKVTWANIKANVLAYFNATAKATPVNADRVWMGDSTASNVPVYSTWTQIKAALFGTAATQNTGTSGATLPFLNGANTWSGIQSFSAIPSLTGGAVSFPATQVPSAGANDLDDYEEGTFTPTLRFGGASVGITYSVQSGTYTKTGRVVVAQVKITLTAKGSSTGIAQIAPLPFTAQAQDFHGSVSFYSAMSGLSNNVLPYVSASSAVITLTTGGAAAAAFLAETNFTNTTNLELTVSYFV